VSSEDIFPAVLQAFIGQMDFHMFDFDIALRKVRPPSNQDL
jgi:Sec7-like guanine-nucleotide exchange factor